MDLLIVRRMLRYGGAGGENHVAPGHTSSRTRNTRDWNPGFAWRACYQRAHPISRTLTLCEWKASPTIHNRPDVPYVCCGSRLCENALE
jgi:hypothetical protein